MNKRSGALCKCYERESDHPTDECDEFVPMTKFLTKLMEEGSQ